MNSRLRAFASIGALISDLLTDKATGNEIRGLTGTQPQYSIGILPTFYTLRHGEPGVLFLNLTGHRGRWRWHLFSFSREPCWNISPLYQAERWLALMQNLFFIIHNFQRSGWQTPGFISLRILLWTEYKLPTTIKLRYYFCFFIARTGLWMQVISHFTITLLPPKLFTTTCQKH